jgi:hypothetical protein
MNRWRMILATLLTIPVVLGIAGMLAWHYGNRISATKMAQDKRSFDAQVASAIPPGSSKASVEQFLDSRRMIHGDVASVSDETIGGKTVESVIETISKDSLEVPLGSCSISAKFKFDSRGVLLGYTDRHSCKWIW